MKIELLTWDKIPLAIELIGNTFLQFVAPDYSEEGVKAFFEFPQSFRRFRNLATIAPQGNKRVKKRLEIQNKTYLIAFLYI